ncbi:MAG: hypothetical protein KGJ80_01870 [Chloroflexota bacterium]|nr:hypothetical protein [Chloroflexota bacterium]
MITSKTKAIYVEPILALLISMAWVFGIQPFTNKLDTKNYSWDFKLYIDMAENGIVNNPNLRAPYAYRFVTTEIVRAISSQLQLSTESSFRVVSYFGLITSLFLVYLASRYFGLGFQASLITMATVALSALNIKFLLFDVFRPDLLAYSLMTIAMLCLLEGRLIFALLVSCVGILCREFLLIPALLVVYAYWRQGQTKWQGLGRAGLACIPIALATLLPRLLIPVQGSDLAFDPVYRLDAILNIVILPLSPTRDFNILFSFVSYILPSLLLITPDRLRRAMPELKRWSGLLLAYIVIMLLLSMYGGDDFPRFMSFLYFPQIVLLALVFKSSKIPTLEIGLMLLAVALFNRIWLPVPMSDIDSYLDFYGGYGFRVTAATFSRVAEMGVYVLIAILLRVWLKRQSNSIQPVNA